MKVVINNCCGGFSLSKEAMDFLYDNKCSILKTFLQDEANGNYNYRSDPILVKAVEVLRDKACGNGSDLKIIDIPDNTHYTIFNYAGDERIFDFGPFWS